MNDTHKKCTSRRSFFKKLIIGAGGLTLADSLREYLMPGQSGVVAAPIESPSDDKTIYGRYFLRGNGGLSTPNESVSLNGTPNLKKKTGPEPYGRMASALIGTTATIGWQEFNEPVNWETSHTHEYDELLIFLGKEMSDLYSSFDAEIDLWMGEEMEKHTITSTTVVFIPKGVQHAPLNFRAIRKPVLFHESPVHLP